MDYKSFKSYVKNNILDYMDEKYKGLTVAIEEVKKTNAVYDGLMLKGGSPYQPVVNLDRFYDIFMDVKDLESVMTDIAAQLAIEPPEHLRKATEVLDDYENAKEHLVIRLNKSSDKFDNVPHRSCEDMVITYYIDLGEACATVTNDIMNSWGVSEETIYEDAMKSSPTVQPVEVSDLGAMFGNIGTKKVSVVTNKSAMYGAAAMLYPNVLEEVSEGKKVYILPSSIHEVLVHHDCDTSVKDLLDMVKSANSMVVDEIDRLADHVYVYENGKLSTAA